jgi:hypothetical protein
MGAKKPYKSDPAQYLLDFNSNAADQRRRLRQALQATPGADLRQWSFLLWIFNVETPHCGLVKDYDEIGEVLWCNRSTAIRMANRLFEVEFVSIRQTFDADGGARKNEYRILWPTIDSLVRNAISANYGASVSPSQFAPPQWQNATTPSQDATTQWQNAPSSKEYDLIPGSCIQENPDPETEPRMVRDSAEEVGLQRIAPDAAGLRIDLFAKLPELQAASQRQLQPLPAGIWQYSVWKGLGLKHLGSFARLLDWHRRQLSTSKPVCGPTVADLLLTVAAGMYANKLPKEKVQRNRVALFVTLISRGQWQRVAGYVPDASKLLACWEANERTPAIDCDEGKLTDWIARDGK